MTNTPLDPDALAVILQKHRKIRADKWTSWACTCGATVPTASMQALAKHQAEEISAYLAAAPKELNPDAIEAVARTKYERWRQINDIETKWDELRTRPRESFIKSAEHTINAYIEIVQPEQNVEVVTKWQDLRSLPIRTVIMDKDDRLMRVVGNFGGGRNMFELMGNEPYCDDRQVTLPARILDRPKDDS